MSASFFNNSNDNSCEDIKLGVDPCEKNTIYDCVSSLLLNLNKTIKLYGFLPIKYLEFEKEYIFDSFINNISNFSNEIFYYYKSKRNCIINKNKISELKEMFFENISSCHHISIINNKLTCNDPIDQLLFKCSNWLIYESKFNEETLCQNFDDTIASFVRPSQEKDLNEKFESLKKKYSELNEELNCDDEENILKEHYELGIVRKFECDDNSYKKTVIVKDINDNFFKIFSKGNPSIIQDLCKPDSIPKNFKEKVNEYKKDGKIVIALAGKIVKMNYLQSQMIERNKCERNMIFLGFVIIERLKNKNIDFL